MTDTKIQSNDNDINERLAWCRDKLTGYAGEIVVNPMTNSVQRLAHDLAMDLEGDAISLEEIRAMMSNLGDEALLRRADLFAERHPGDENCVTQFFKDRETEKFSSIQKTLEQTRAGIVFTGHPTFAISKKLREDFISYIESGEASRQKARDQLTDNRHRPDEPITLDSEHDEVKNAIENAVSAVDAINRSIFESAEQAFPEHWFKMVPQPLSVATWVGYDLDGRTDIHWAQTLTIRLNEKAEQLEKYVSDLERIAKLEGASSACLDIAGRLKRTASLTRQQAALFSGDLDDPDIVVKASNALSEDHPDRLVSLGAISDELTAMIEGDISRDVRIDLCLLRARMKTCGLGLSRIHLRVNAAQVRSALRHDLGVNSDADFMGRGALDIAAREASQANQLKVNFASVFLEQMTARRQLMLCAQILKHIDGDTPLRFLIAECEAPATIMGAVYLARAYGVDHMLDISPLFETPEALERGGRFLDRLVQEDEYCDYVRRRGRLSIQLGYSDSGRFMGQVAANIAIERLHILLSRAMTASGLNDIEALIFNTNGDSMGRGGYPGSIEQRMNHLITPWTRGVFADAGQTLNMESAFQGGEGFLHFLTPQIADRTAQEIFTVAYSPASLDKEDMFYKDINFSWDYYRGVKAWQEALFDNPDYTSAFSSFGQKFLFTTGSRKTRRQRKGAIDFSPRALRAIPHNAILQQMAIPANVACGTGTAISREKDRFADYVRGSGRMKQLIGLAERARNLTSLPSFLGYANIYNASYWTRRATASPNPACAGCYLQIAQQLRDQTVFTALGRLGNSLAVDLAAFDECLEIIHGESPKPVRHEERLGLHTLHALRQSVIMHALVLVARLPAFSGRHEVTQADLIDLVLHLDFDELISLLKDIFPVQRPEIAAMSGVKEPTSVDLSGQTGYPEVRHEIIDPLQHIHTIILETGVAISHFYGAYG